MIPKLPIESGIGKKIAQGILLAGGSYLTYHFGRKAYLEWKRRNATYDLDRSPEVRQAMGLRSAMNPSGISWLRWGDGTKDSAIKLIAREIVDLNDVIKAYRNLYNGALIQDLQSELDIKEFHDFLQIISNNKINSSSGNASSGSETGNYTQVKNLIVAKKAVNVRTSPDASSHGAWYEVRSTNNIFRTAQAGEFIGYATGKQEFDSVNNVKFIEVAYRQADSGKIVVLWVSASSNYVDQFTTVQEMTYKYPQTKTATQSHLPLEGLGFLSHPEKRAITRCETQLLNKEMNPHSWVKANVILGYPVMMLQGKGANYTLIKTMQGLERWVESNHISII